jgi:hypothetical protein
MLNLVRAATALAAALLVAACAASGSPSAAPLEIEPAPVSQASSSAPSVAPSPASFTSTTYGYSLMLPGGWKAIQATAVWDGNGSGGSFSAPVFDQFASPAALSAAAFAAPTTQDLASYVKERIAANAADHGDTCPPVPDVNGPIEIGGKPGMLLGWNCGILINQAVTVHGGIGYLFGLRDPAIHAASDPADREALLELLGSVSFPD